jgi:hypothetical protein
MNTIRRREAAAFIATAAAWRADAAEAPLRNYAPTDNPNTIAIWLKARASRPWCRWRSDRAFRKPRSAT